MMPPMPYIIAPCSADSQRSIQPLRMYWSARPARTLKIPGTAQTKKMTLGLAGGSAIWPRVSPIAKKAAPTRQPRQNKTFPARVAIPRTCARNSLISTPEIS